MCGGGSHVLILLYIFPSLESHHIFMFVDEYVVCLSSESCHASIWTKQIHISLKKWLHPTNITMWTGVTIELII